MPIHLLFFDHTDENIKAYNEHISIDTSQYKSAFVCSDVKELVKEYAVTFILSPANSLGFMDGGIDMIYMQMFPGIQDRVQSQIAKFNIQTALGRKVLPIGSNILVKTNDTDTPYLCCCPTMFLPGSIGEADNVYWAFIGLLQTLKHYISVEKLVVAIPCLGTGVGRMKATHSAQQIQRAFDDFIGNKIVYNARIVADSPKGFVIDRFEAVQESTYANTEIKNIQTQRKILKVLTWNIWFKIFHFEERMDHIIEEVKRHDPDIICFQEVINKSLAHFKKDDYISYKYDIMHDTRVETGYGDIILIKKSIKECFMTSEHYPETKMNRRITRVYLPYFDCEVCTTHLESIYKRNNAHYLENNTKHNQLRFLLEETSQSKAKNVILAGDFNVGDEDEDTFKTLIDDSPFDDVFNMLPEDRRGGVINTYDSSVNKNILGNYSSRLDRIYLMSRGIEEEGTRLKPFSYQVIGMTPFIPKVQDKQGYIFPSDHFGILCTFTL